TSTGDLPAPKKVKPPRSHWDMLMERRSVADLEEVLAERLAVIRGQRQTGTSQSSASATRQRKSA
ncbi:MAG TPA: RNA polymerase-binding protein RbpA, partial [Streptosporangiaceae bacterium]|nr:RNA polymerase-binding protein RbpA [Streptosporangiaceae bacterium]